MARRRSGRMILIFDSQHQWHTVLNIRGASKIKLKKVNKKRTVRVRRVIIFLNISRHPLLIWLHCCFHHYKFLKAVATAKAAIVLLTPVRNLNKVFWGFLVVFPLFNHFLGYVEIYLRVIWPKKLISKPLRGSNLPLIWRFFEFLRSKKFACKILP